MIDKRFGKLIVKELSKEPKTRGRGRHWTCQCDCGNICIKTTSELNSGYGKSCGCITKTHGMSGERLYSIWQDMRRRCYNDRKLSYKDYGGRGISYDQEWEDFSNFYRDMGDTYDSELTLERIDVNGDYTKENCEWIPVCDQAKNKRKYSNNSIGVAGCGIVEDKGKLYVRARVQDTLTKKRITKLFSLSDKSIDEALSLAKDWLKEKRSSLGYKETHGNEG